MINVYIFKKENIHFFSRALKAGTNKSIEISLHSYDFSYIKFTAVVRKLTIFTQILTIWVSGVFEVAIHTR
jgi:hypothetical protein